MPRDRRYRPVRRPRRYSKYPKFPRRYGQGDTGYRLNMLARGLWYLKGQVNSETKKGDFGISTSASTTGTTVDINSIAQGDTQSTRTGNSIFVRSVDVRIMLTQNASATQSFVKVVLVKDNQQIADTDPSWTDVYQSAEIDSFLNLANTGRFTVLKQQTISLSSTGNTAKYLNWHVPMRHHVRYNSTAASDIQKGGLYVMYLSNEAVNSVGMDGRARVSFKDN